MAERLSRLLRRLPRPVRGESRRKKLALNPRLLVEPAAEQTHVAHVGAEHDVECVARERHHADHAIERDIAEHARGEVPGRAQRTGLAHQPQRDRRGDDVADDRDQTDQSVDAVADVGAGQDEGDVEQLCDRLEPRDPLLARQMGEWIALPEIEAKLAKSLLKRFGADFMALLVDDRAARRRARGRMRAVPRTGPARSNDIVVGQGQGLEETRRRGGSCCTAPERRALRSAPPRLAAP